MVSSKNKLDKKTLQTIDRLLGQNKKTNEIVNIVNLSRSTVCRAIKNINLFGQEFIEKFDEKLNRRTSAEQDQELKTIKNIIEDSINSNPAITQSGIQNKIIDQGLYASQPKISRLISSLGYTRKRLTLIPEGRNCPRTLELRREYVSFVINRPDSETIFVDECGFNIHTNPYYGYSKANCKAYKIVPNSRGRNRTLLCAISVRGIVAHKIIEGACNAEIFSQFIENEVASNRTDNEKLLIMDNVKFHHSRQVINATINIGLSPRFLPPYSPMLNPIEEVFSSLKAHFSRYPYQIRTNTELMERIEETIFNFDSNFEGYFSHMRSYFQSCLQKQPLI